MVKHRTAIVLVLGVAGLCTFLIAGDINPPPGPVAPTMKTLVEVEPRIAVNPTNTPGSTTALYVISLPGSYYLTGNIQGIPGKHGVLVAADNVTLDLSGYGLVGAGAGDFDGVSLDQTPLRRNVAVVNGTIRNWGRDGVNTVFGGADCIFRNLRLSNNGRNGLAANSGTVTDCVAMENSASGIVVYGSTVTACMAQWNGQGFGVLYGGTLVNCTALSNGTGALVSEGASVRDCVFRSNTGPGLVLGNGVTALNNLSDANGGQGIEFPWWWGDFSDTRVEGNTVVRNGGDGINMTGAVNCIFLRNSAAGNATNYVVAAGNSHGPIVNVAGVGDISSVTGANHPWANFSH